MQVGVVLSTSESVAWTVILGQKCQYRHESLYHKVHMPPWPGLCVENPEYKAQGTNLENYQKTEAAYDNRLPLASTLLLFGFRHSATQAEFDGVLSMLEVS